MNILLVYPQFPDTFWSFKHALKFIRRKAAFPPLGLLTVAAMLPEKWNQRLVDTNVQPLSEEDLLWADYAFLSAMDVQRASVESIIRQCRDANLKIVAGGPLFTTQHQTFGDVDHFVLNEAELTLPPFIRDMEQGFVRRMYTSGEYADIRKTPAPRWDLANFRDYASIPIQYSRGCPYQCEFCSVTALFGHRPRTKTGEQVTTELESLYRMGWRRNVFFVDDNLIGNRRHLKSDLLPALIEWRKEKTGMRFGTEVSINMADDEELMRLMVASGFDTVFVGIETPEEESLVECGKQHNLNRDIVANIKRIQRAGMEVQGGFILGFDNDTPSTFQRLSDLVQNSGIVTAMVGLLQAPHGTMLYERLKKVGRIVDHMSGDNADGTTNIVPVMNAEVLRKGYRTVLEHLYSPKVYYRRIRTFLREYQPPVPRVKLSVRETLVNLRALSRSVFSLGVIGKERVQYWKLFIWTLLRRPKSFGLAIRLAIYGRHFRKISEQGAS